LLTFRFTPNLQKKKEAAPSATLSSPDYNAGGRELDMELGKSCGAQKKRQGRENIRKMNLNVFRFLE
jgi:hypothetical protein